MLFNYHFKCASWLLLSYILKTIIPSPNLYVAFGIVFYIAVIVPFFLVLLLKLGSILLFQYQFNILYIIFPLSLI